MWYQSLEKLTPRVKCQDPYRCWIADKHLREPVALWVLVRRAGTSLRCLHDSSPERQGMQLYRRRQIVPHTP